MTETRMVTTGDRAVQGHCPMGCGRTLFLAAGGLIVCSATHCPRRDAVTGLLADDETEHIVELGETAFMVRHPLRERLDDELMNCALHAHIASLDGPPATPGRYRVTGDLTDLTWTAQNGVDTAVGPIVLGKHGDEDIIPAEGQHVVAFEHGAFMVRHPPSERQAGDCGLLKYILSLPERPAPIGSYLVTGQPGDLTWKKIP